MIKNYRPPTENILLFKIFKLGSNRQIALFSANVGVTPTNKKSLDQVTPHFNR